MTPEIQIYLIAEPKCAELHNLYDIFMRSATTYIQGVLETSSKQTTSIIGINLA